MRRIRPWCRLLVAALLPIACLTLLPPPARAMTFTPDSSGPSNSFQHANFQGSVYGDFAIVGNGVLRCPLPGEQGGDRSADCRRASTGAAGDDNGFYLQRSGADGQGTFDSSQARVTIPAGATVRYAQLNWGGNTGRTDLDITVPPVLPPVLSPALPPALAPALPPVLPSVLSPALPPALSPVLPAVLPSLLAPALPPVLPSVAPSVPPAAPPSAADPGPTSPEPLADIPLPLTSCTGLAVPTLVPNLLAPAQPPPAPPAAPAPDQQSVQLSVTPGGAPGPARPVSVQPTNYGASGERTELYSAYADVTDAVTAAVPTAAAAAVPTTLTVSVGNVWALSGYGCAAGWSLVVVFGYPRQPTDPNNPYRHLREVDVYSDRFVQEGGMTSTFAIPAPNRDADTAGVELGVTAYDGDPGGSGTFSVGGRPANDPCSADTGGSANFLSSCAQGALDPFDPTMPIRNNFSVDAKAIEPAKASDLSPPGSSVDISLGAAADPYLLQTVVLSENIAPALAVTIAGPSQAVHAGDPVPLTVDVRDTGDVPLYNVVLTVATTGTPAQCQPAQLGTLAPGNGVALSCTVTAGNATFPATATATGNYRLNDTGSAVTASATTTVAVIGPVLSVALSAAPQVVRKGRPVTLTFTVGNGGTAAAGPLDATVATNPALPGCAPAPVSQVAPGSSATTTCAVTPNADLTVAATATATDPAHSPATATSQPQRIGVVNPALDIAVIADPTDVAAGKPVNFTVAVHNTGDVALAVTTADDLAQACDFTTPTQGLAPGAAQSQKCTVTAPDAAGTLTDSARFTAYPVGKTASGIPVGNPSPDDAISGHAAASARVEPPGNAVGGGQSGGGQSGGGGGAGGGGAGGSAGGGSGGGGGAGGGSNSGLAYTGVAVGGPVALGLGLLVGGGAMALRRPRGRRTDGDLARRGLRIRR